MANINIDLNYKQIKQNIQGVSTYTYKDLGTSNIKILYKKQDGKQIAYLYDKNSSNKDINAIKQSLKNIFSFLPGQSILDPAFGNTLYKFIYQRMTDIVKSEIIRQIKNLIIKYQPRIQLLDIKIQKKDQQLAYNIILRYGIPALNITSTDVISLSSSDGITFN